MHFPLSLVRSSVDRGRRPCGWCRRCSAVPQIQSQSSGHELDPVSVCVFSTAGEEVVFRHQQQLKVTSRVPAEVPQVGNDSLRGLNCEQAEHSLASLVLLPGGGVLCGLCRRPVPQTQSTAEREGVPCGDEWVWLRAGGSGNHLHWTWGILLLPPTDSDTNSSSPLYVCVQEDPVPETQAEMLETPLDPEVYCTINFHKQWRLSEIFIFNSKIFNQQSQIIQKENETFNLTFPLQ